MRKEEFFKLKVGVVRKQIVDLLLESTSKDDEVNSTVYSLLLKKFDTAIKLCMFYLPDSSEKSEID